MSKSDRCDDVDQNRTSDCQQQINFDIIIAMEIAAWPVLAQGYIIRAASV